MLTPLNLRAALLATAALTTFMSLPAQAQQAQPSNSPNAPQAAQTDEIITGGSRRSVDEQDVPVAIIAMTAEELENLRLKGFDEVIVTARKRSENIQEVPVTVSAFTSKMIEQSGFRDLSDIAKSTPGFSLDDEFGRTSGVRPVIRGQATILGASGVSTFVDGILLNGSILDYDLNDVERVEIVKGPQSALYGRNTYSGAINIITKSPTDAFAADIKLDAGSNGRFEASAAMRGPISDVMSGGINARYFKRGGPFTNTFDGSDVGQQESASLSGVLYYEPTDDLSVRARVRVSKLHDDQPRLFNTAPSENNVFFDDGGVYLGNGRYFEGEIVEHDISVDDVRLLDDKGYEDVESLQASVAAMYNINDNLSVEFINGVNLTHNDSAFDFGHTAESLNPFSVYIGPAFPLGGPFFFHAYVVSGPVADLASVSEGTSSDISSEVRFKYETDNWTGLLGGYFYNEQGRSTGQRQAPAAFAEIVEQGYDAQIARMTAQCAAHAHDAIAPCLSVPGFDSIVNFGDDLEDLQFFADRSIRKNERQNLALFGSFSYDLNEQFNVSVAGRYKSEKVVRNTIDRSAVYDFRGDQVDFVTAPVVERSETFNSFNPRLTLKYKLSDNVNLYGIAARGDKPGGFNNINAIPLGFGTFDEETVWALEGGAKTTLLDGGLTFNMAAYHNTISDYQLTQALTLPVVNQTTTVISNLGTVRVAGFEADMLYRVPTIPGWTVNMNYAYANSKITEGVDITEGRHLDVLDDGLVNCSTGFADPAAGCNQGDNVLPGSIAGNRLPRAPRHTFNVGTNYKFALTDNLDMTLNGEVTYESKKFVQVHNLAYVGDSLLVGGQIGFSTDSQSITIWGRNLTDEDAVVSAQRFIDEARSFQRAFAGNPRVGREFGATYRLHF